MDETPRDDDVRPFSRRRLQVSNAEFLREVFRDDAWRAHVTGFKEDPTSLDTSGLRHYWGGMIWGQGGEPLCQPDFNNFFTISVFDPDPALQQHRRRKANYALCYCIVFDDVNLRGVDWNDTSAKVPADKIAPLKPSWTLETSPNNFQVGYILEAGDPRGGKVTALLNGLVATGLVADGTDPGMKGVTRYCRLPVGRNTKTKYGTKGFLHNLESWRPERKYTLEDIADAFGLRGALDAAPDALGVSASTVVLDPDADWQLRTMYQLGHVHGERVGAGGQILWDVTCPHIDRHSQRADSGTVYMGGGRWDCRHRCSEWCDPEIGKQPEYWRFDERLEQDFPKEVAQAKREVLAHSFGDGQDFGDAGVPQRVRDAETLEAGKDAFEGYGFEEVHTETVETRELGPYEQKMDVGFTLTGAVAEGVSFDQAWLLKHICQPEGVGTVLGLPGAGKSFFVMDMACRAVVGMDWQGHAWKVEGLVLYVASEGGRIGLKHRALAWHKTHGVVSDRLIIYPGTIPMGAGPEAEAEVDLLIKWLRRWSRKMGLPISMVIVDTLNRNMIGDENSTADMTAMTQACDRIAKSVGTFVWLVHHVGKDASKGARGSSVLLGVVDVEIRLERDEGTNKGTIYLSKNRAGQDGLVWGYELVDVMLGLDSDGDRINSLVIGETAPTKKAAKLTMKEQIVMRAYDDLAGGVGTADVPIKDLTKRAGDMTKFGDVKDLTETVYPPAEFRRALDGLIEKGLMRVDTDTGLVRVNETDFTAVETPSSASGG